LDAFYARFFPGEHSDAEYGYLEEVAARLSKARSVLDFGCGANTDLARYRTPTREVWGVDVQEHPLLEHPAWFRQFDETGRAPFSDGSFDVIVSCWVLEHVKDPSRFLEEIQRLLRPGGCFVAVSINALHYVTLLSRLFSMLPHRLTKWLVKRLYGRPTHDTFPTWYRLNRQRRLKRLASKAGLKVASFTRYANPDYFSFSPLLRRCAIVIDYLLNRVSPSLGRLYFVTTLRKPRKVGQLPEAVVRPTRQPAHRYTRTIIASGRTGEFQDHRP
jgi:2-polyprenyl-3-methyl-5-hydroxy-6-metoxy-1,4-benzoquinol methylase